MNTYSMNLDIKSVQSGGFFAGYGSINHNTDSYRDVVQPGAFAKSIADWTRRGKMPPVLWSHNASEPIGVYRKLEENDRGLYVEAQLLVDDVPRAKEIHALMKAGAVDGLSIGYQTEREEYDAQTKTTRLHELKLWEISVVTFPANPEARIEQVKQLIQDGALPSLPDFERFLRDAGFSKSQATAVAGYGLRSLLRDAADPTAKNLIEAVEILKGQKL